MKRTSRKSPFAYLVRLFGVLLVIFAITLGPAQIVSAQSSVNCNMADVNNAPLINLTWSKGAPVLDGAGQQQGTMKNTDGVGVKLANGSYAVCVETPQGSGTYVWYQVVGATEATTPPPATSNTTIDNIFAAVMWAGFIYTCVFVYLDNKRTQAEKRRKQTSYLAYWILGTSILGFLMIGRQLHPLVLDIQAATSWQEAIPQILCIVADVVAAYLAFTNAGEIMGVKKGIPFVSIIGGAQPQPAEMKTLEPEMAKARKNGNEVSDPIPFLGGFIATAAPRSKLFRHDWSWGMLFAWGFIMRIRVFGLGPLGMMLPGYTGFHAGFQWDLILLLAIVVIGIFKELPGEYEDHAWDRIKVDVLITLGLYFLFPVFSVIAFIGPSLLEIAKAPKEALQHGTGDKLVINIAIVSILVAFGVTGMFKLMNPSWPAALTVIQAVATGIQSAIAAAKQQSFLPALNDVATLAQLIFTA